MDGFWGELLLIFFFIAGNAYFAAAEIALVSARKAPIAALAQKGDKRAQLVARLQTDPDTFLATVQVGISLMTILAGVLGGAVFVSALQSVFESISVPWIQSAASGISFVVVTLTITYLSMVLGELVPKSYTLKHPERVAMKLAGSVHFLSRMTYPAVRGLAASGRWIAQLLGGGKIEKPTFITEDEVRWLIREGHKQGVFDDTERDLVAQVFSFADTYVRRAMTPRTDIAAIDSRWDQKSVLEFIAREGYSRYPVYEETIDKVIGVIHTKDVINILMTGGLIVIDDLIRPPMFVPDSRKLGPVLREMQTRQEHQAMVLDEFGGTAGLITLEDLLEEIVGEIRDEHDAEPPEFTVDDSGSATMAGKLPIDEFNEFFDARLDEAVADTIAGYLTSILGHIPDADETVETDGVRFRVVAVEENRITRIVAERIGSSEKDG